MSDDIHAVLARCPFENEPERLARLSPWQRYCLEHARQCVLDNRDVPADMVAELRHVVWYLDLAKGA